MGFQAETYFPGVTHISDSMGVCMTLLAGRDGAVLVDAGYGLEDVRAYIRSLTDLPVRLILSHGHHDHALGAMHFDRVSIHPDDMPVYRTYTGETQRRLVLASAAAKGLAVDETAFLGALMPEPELTGAETLDLGGLTVRVIPCPGHTPGSLVFYVPEHRLLLTADDWNPTTWLFFREALPVLEYRKNMQRQLEELPFSHVLCSHRQALFARETVEAFFGGLTDDCLRRAEPCDEGRARSIRTGRAVPADGQQLVFDLDKYREA